MTLLVILGVVAIVLVLALAAFRGLVLTYLWAWFLVPFGLPEIGIAHAIGITLIAAMLTKEVPDADKDGGEPSEKLERGIKRFVGAFTLTLLVWGIGYILHGIAL